MFNLTLDFIIKNQLPIHYVPISNLCKEAFAMTQISNTKTLVLFKIKFLVFIHNNQTLKILVHHDFINSYIYVMYTVEANNYYLN